MLKRLIILAALVLLVLLAFPALSSDRTKTASAPAEVRAAILP